MSSGLAAWRRAAHARRIGDETASPWRLPLLALGWALIALALVVPGGVFLFAGGLALVLNNSVWAKRRYVTLKQRWPKLGRLADRALRRPDHDTPPPDAD